MIFIFEDNENSELSKLFREAYSEEERKLFRYSGGDRGVMNEINRLFEDKKFAESDEKVTVFLDVVPDNPETTDLYNYIFANCEIKYPNRLLIVPIICAEYYFINSLKDTNLIVNTDLFNRCINKINYKKEVADTSRKEYESFEKFCKYVKESAFKGCTKHRRGGIRTYYLKYDCNSNCKSKSYTKDCNELTLSDKSIRLLAEYPFVPNLKEHSNKRDIAYDEAVLIKNKLFDELIDFEDELVNQGFTVKKEIWRKIKC